MIWRNLGLIALFLVGCLLLTILWLRYYTHHGQSLVLPDYVGQHLDIANLDAEQKSFQIVVVDSSFIVGKEGGLILAQNPAGQSQVKERRKIYVTITKNEADQIPVRRLPILYGKSYDRKSKELKQGFEINSKVVGKRHDSGEPDHILEVRYRGETIISGSRRKDEVMVDKGGTLEMIVSKSTGGSLTMPDLKCKQYDEAVFQLQALQLHVAEAEASADVSEPSEGFVWRQNPIAEARVYTGDTVTLYLSGQPPAGCDF